MKSSRSRTLVLGGLLAAMLGAGCSIYSESLLGNGKSTEAGRDTGREVGIVDGSTRDVTVPREAMAGPPSCAAGTANTCGPSASIDCCTTLVVNGGTFTETLEDGGVAETTVDTFDLDKYEVTVARFREFVQAGFGTQSMHPALDAGASPHVPGSGWDSAWNTNLPASTAALEAKLGCDDDVGPTWTNNPTNDEGLPINCVSWFEAFAFCVWDGGRLPSFAEWGYAAAGGNDGRIYPWSSPATSSSIGPINANYSCNASGMTTFYDAGADANAAGLNFECLSLSDITPPGHYPAGTGLYGQEDLGGNMLEWVFDTCSVCAPSVADGGGLPRIQRGGGYDDPVAYLANAQFVWDYPASLFDDDGFRCARDP